MDLLDKLYHGRFCASTLKENQSVEYQQCLKRIDEQVRKVKIIIPREDMHLLNDLQDLYSALLSEEAKHYFKIGISFQQEYQAEVKHYYQEYILKNNSFRD